MKKENRVVKEYLSRIASKGGNARAKKYDKATLAEWGKKGGRPPKKKEKQ